jgi:proline iminopeptidase
VRRVSFAGGVEDLEGLREHLGLGRIQVLGHSTGAYLAALYAAEHPATTARVVMLNPGPPLVADLMEQFGQTMSSDATDATTKHAR